MESSTVVTALFANVAVLSGTVLGGVEFQFVPWVHSLPRGATPPCQVPSTARAVSGVNTANAPSQTLASSTARSPACADSSEVGLAMR